MTPATRSAIASVAIQIAGTVLIVTLFVVRELTRGAVASLAESERDAGRAV